MIVRTYPLRHDGIPAGAPCRLTSLKKDPGSLAARVEDEGAEGREVGSADCE